MNLARPTEDLGIDSILVNQVRTLPDFFQSNRHLESISFRSTLPTKSTDRKCLVSLSQTPKDLIK